MHTNMRGGGGEGMYATMRGEGGEGEGMHTTMRGGGVRGCMPL